MMIIDVIRQAGDEHEIFFLVSAYIEAVRHCDKLKTLPEHMWTLPLAGTDDLETRTEGLESKLDGPSQPLPERERLIVCEAVDIFAAALYRLHALEQATPHRQESVENSSCPPRTDADQVAAARLVREASRQSTTVSNSGFARKLSDSPSSL